MEVVIPFPLRCSCSSSTSSSPRATSFRKVSNFGTHHFSKPSSRLPPPIRCYKESFFYDFKDYAKPVRLLPVSEPIACSETLQEQAVGSLHLEGSRSLVKVKARTSNMYGSSLSDTNAGVILCLIDEKGDSVLQRIPPVLKSASSENDSLLFQRGSVDEFTFEAPKTGRIEALWLGVQSGQWRVGGLSVTIISTCQLLAEESEEEKTKYLGYHYEFKADDVLLGEGNDAFLLELRPTCVSEESGDDILTLSGKTPNEPLLAPGGGISNEESMREYKDLKVSLLLYDALLIAVGSLVVDLSVGDSAAVAFFVGGIFGFSYLLLIQRSVDRLPTSPPAGGNDRTFGGFSSPASSLALAIGLTFFAAKYSIGNASSVITAREVLAGMMGFLACKVAVVIAAFKPMSRNFKEKE